MPVSYTHLDVYKRQWHDIAKGFCRKRSYQYDDDIPDNLAACADDADSVFGIGIYRSSCRTPAL